MPYFRLLPLSILPYRSSFTFRGFFFRASRDFPLFIFVFLCFIHYSSFAFPPFVSHKCLFSHSMKNIMENRLSHIVLSLSLAIFIITIFLLPSSKIFTISLIFFFPLSSRYLHFSFFSVFSFLQSSSLFLFLQSTACCCLFLKVEKLEITQATWIAKYLHLNDAFWL